MKEYVIQKVAYTSDVWDSLEKVNIDTYRWMHNDYRPTVYAKLCYDDAAIHIKFWAYEKKVRGEYHNLNDPVCTDSCVEFFLRPIEDKRFLNIETNVLGTMLIGIGKSRRNRTSLQPDMSVFRMHASVKNAAEYHGDYWTIEYDLPFDFLKNYYGDIDFTKGIRANLYKCGDKTEFEHYGMWNPVRSLIPDFHRPLYFGRMTFGR